MRTLADVKPDWRETPPTYENLSDKSTMEWNLIEEVQDVKKELQNLAEISEKVHTQLVNGLQYGHIKTWEEVVEILSNWCVEMEEKMEAVTDRFYY